MSRLTHIIRRWWTSPRRPRGWGPVLTVRHSFYGVIRVFRWDTGISRHLLDGRTIWEHDIVAIFAQEFPAGRNVIDAGANLGLHSIALAKLATRGEVVYAIEAHPEVFALTRFNCSRFANIRCIDRAASDQPAIVSMPTFRGSRNAAITSVTAEPVAGHHSVEAVTIDSLGLENIGFMKIDVEGHELACIRGASETIQRDRPTLLVEICGGNDIQTAPPPIAAQIRSTIEEIVALGYDATQVSPHDYLFRPLAAKTDTNRR